MNTAENRYEIKQKQLYEEPVMQRIAFATADVITTSSGDNLGEWDPQASNK